MLTENDELMEDKKKIIVVSVSPQALASIALKFSMNMTECLQKLASFFKSIGCHYVFDTKVARNFSLMNIGKEFVQRLDLFRVYCKTCAKFTRRVVRDLRQILRLIFNELINFYSP